MQRRIAHRSAAVSSPTCEHITGLKVERKAEWNSLLNSYKLLHAFYVACIRESSFRRKKSDCICKVTNCSTKRKRIHACLSCIYFGCYYKSHIQTHAHKYKHFLAMETSFGQVYCAKCGDYKYDEAFIKIAQQQNKIASLRRSNCSGKSYKWEPSVEEINLLKKHEIVYKSKIGIRGLVNISKFTCYLNSPIQCLIHAPVFRDYLLSFQHRCASTQDERPSCFICEMAAILQELISGKREPFALERFLFLLFKRVNILAQEKYQDACECLIYILDNFHEDEIKGHERNEEEFPGGSQQKACECIFHKIFRCHFKRRRTCNNQQSPHTDFLEIGDSKWTIDVTLYQLPESTHVKEVSFKEYFEKSLYEHRDDYFCPECQENVGCSIKLVPKELPYVLIFCTNEDLFNGGKKKATTMIYEKELDMSSYMLEPKFTLEYMYYLFALIEYIPPGHYKSYVRKENKKWYICDDKKIEEIDWDIISTRVKPRLLCYHRMFI